MCNYVKTFHVMAHLMPLKMLITCKRASLVPCFSMKSSIFSIMVFYVTQVKYVNFPSFNLTYCCCACVYKSSVIMVYFMHCVSRPRGFHCVLFQKTKWNKKMDTRKKIKTETNRKTKKWKKPENNEKKKKNYIRKNKTKTEENKQKINLICQLSDTVLLLNDICNVIGHHKLQHNYNIFFRIRNTLYNLQNFRDIETTVKDTTLNGSETAEAGLQNNGVCCLIQKQTLGGVL